MACVCVRLFWFWFDHLVHRDVNDLQSVLASSSPLSTILSVSRTRRPGASASCAVCQRVCVTATCVVDDKRMVRTLRGGPKHTNQRPRFTRTVAHLSVTVN